MSSTSNYDIGFTPALPGRNVIFNNMKAPTAQVDNLSVSLINGLPPPSAPPIVAPVGSILSVTSPGVASFSSDVDILGNIELAGSSGVAGQYIKKTGASTQAWSTIDDGDIAPGLANQVMTTNSTGTEAKWSSTVSVDGDLVFNGIYGTTGQFVMKAPGSQLWHTLSTSDIPAGSNGQVLTTTGGVPTWGLCPQSSITPGTSYQVPQTNSSATSVEWTSNLGIDSITFTNNIANFQSVFNRYYTSDVQLPLYANPIGGSPFTYQNINVNGYFSVIGKRVELTIYPFSLGTLFGGATAPCYLSLLIAPSFLRAANLLGLGNDGQRQSTVQYKFSQNLSVQPDGLANIYNNYYGTNVCYLEFTKGISSTFVQNGYHGDDFGAFVPFFELVAPFTISYIA